MGEMPDGWCAPPFRFQPENEHGDPAPIVFDESYVFTDDDIRHVRMLNAIDRMVWAMSTARKAHGFAMIADVN